MNGHSYPAKRHSRGSSVSVDVASAVNLLQPPPLTPDYTFGHDDHYTHHHDSKHTPNSHNHSHVPIHEGHSHNMRGVFLHVMAVSFFFCLPDLLYVDVLTDRIRWALWVLLYQHF